MERAQLPRPARDVPQGRLRGAQAVRDLRGRAQVPRRRSLTLQRVSFVVGGLRRKGELVGTLHLPQGTASGSALILHGYGGDQEQPHVVETCAALAAVGVAALRFPYRDHQPPRMTVATALEDARAAIRLLDAHPEAETRRLAVVGFSFGGVIAALLAARERHVRSAVLAAAPAEFRAERPRPLDELRRTRARVLLLWGSRDSEVPSAHAMRYADVLARAGVPHRFATVEGGDHDFDPSTARAQMARMVADWVRESFAGLTKEG